MDRIRQMEVFAQIVDSGSFTRAAEVLGLPRSTLSTMVQGLENRLGAQLLHRTTRALRPTPDGLRYLAHARGLIDAMDEAETLFSAAPAALTGHLRIDMPSRLARRTVIPALPEFLDAHPELTLDLSATDRRIDLLSEGVDAVVRMGERADSEMISRVLGYSPQASVASADYIARHGQPQTPEELSQHWLVNFAQHMPARTAELELKGAVSVPMQSRFCVDNAESYYAAALSGLGIIQAPRHSFEAALQDGRLVEILPDLAPDPMTVSFLYPSRRNLAPRVRAFADWLEALLKRRGVTR
ncbi:LysR family transcriptional regulator [Pararhodobacter sp. CCB-MM2]|uniref:LysR family transcriptional regulator n=1 Tax=Pararhodobacter sp. CCB-MM2 TaxID=1786003 RepID=UPI000830CE98|nr:LysR family transcriptional regulator [Pararhodobacter sp. CCB-MM2]